MPDSHEHDAPMPEPLTREPLTVIDRREAIRRVSMMLGGVAVVGGSGLLSACERAERGVIAPGAGIGRFSAADIAMLDEIAETILPETDTPGARAAEVGAFMALMVTDTYDADDQAVFHDGMGLLEERCRTQHGVGFMEASGAQRLALLEMLDAEQLAHEEARASKDTALAPDTLEPRAAEVDSVSANPSQETRTHHFRMMKELTLLGYFTSEIGCTQALRYVESPGRFDPCVPYTPGETSWASHA